MKIDIVFKPFLLITALFVCIPSKSQSSEILDRYIKQGLENNHVLQRKELNLEKSLKALKEANGLFFPSVGLEAQYFLADGGRSVDLPVGDMLNPVYSSLNQLMQNTGQEGEFPQIENEKIQFLPNNYHDTKLRVILPLVNAEIYYNHKIKKELIGVAQAELNVYKRELIKEIKTAYIRYLQSVKVVEAYNSALELVNEALRVNKKLVENQMAGIEKLYRMEAEKSQVAAQLAKAENDMRTAVSYFNFLINQPLQSSLLTDSLLMDTQITILMPLGQSINKDREEFEQLNSAIRSADYFLKLKKSWLVPSISNVTDLGYQGNYYKFNNEQRYIMNTVTLSLPLFNGFQNRNNAAQARIERETLENQLTEAEQQIELQNRIAEGNLETAIKSTDANYSSLLSSQEYYKAISKQYAVGQKSLLDLLDARNQLTTTQINYTVAYFDTLIRLAELERANASYDLNSTKM
jgi:outer membrane protein